MMSPGDQAWTSGLIPMIEPEEVTKILSRVSDIALIIAKDGTVLSVMSNPSFRGQANLEAWMGHPIVQELTVESVPKLERRLEEFARNQAAPQPLELNHRKTPAYPEFPMRYSFHRIGSDGAVLMLGNDLRSTAEMQQQLVAAQIALEQDYEAQRDNNLKFRVLLGAVEDAIVYVSVRTGKILEVNSAAQTLFGKTDAQLAGVSLGAEVGDPAQGNLVEHLVTSAMSDAATPIAGTMMARGQPVFLHPTLFRTSGDQLILCRISVSADQITRPDDLRNNLTGLFETTVDGIVFIRADGIILSNNEAFLKLADVANAQSVKGRSMADYLSRGSVDLNVILDNASRSGTMRLYATKVKSDLGADRTVEISTSRIKMGQDGVFALIIRDASRVDTVRPAQSQITDVDMKSVIEFIGSQSLKDIVAKTTDVVEKMCIETAVEMTSNNRVAAAEMLGLSRQSLYVKLRKYGLINKD